jgi:hypothetical protein
LKAAKAVVGILCSTALLAAPAVALAGGIKIQNAAYDLESKELVVKAKLDGFDGPVEVTVSDGQGTVLGSLTTDKQVLLHVPYGSVLDVPCDVRVVAGGEDARADVTNCPGPGQTFEIVLSGVVTDEPIPFATVSVTLDGVTYTTTADEFGNYSLPIISANLNQLVRIDAEGTSGSGEPIEFTSLTGTFSRVLDGESSGNVTNVTTASYVLTVEANGGTEPTTAEELATAETSVDATELFELAALIKLIVDNPQYDVPEGQSLIEFISDPVAVEAYTATVPQEDLDAALAEILSDSNLVAGFTAADIPSRYYSIPVASPGFIARNGSALEFDPAGTGTFLGQDGNSGQPIAQTFSWSIDTAGRLVVELDAPIVSTNFPKIDDTPATPEELAILAGSGITQIEEIRTISRYTYTRLTDGTLVDVVQQETREEIVYPAIPLGNNEFLTLGTPEVVDIRTSDSTFRSSLDIEPTPFSATCNGQSVCAVGVWGGAFHYTASPGTFFTGYVFPPTAYGDIMTLAGDGSAIGTLGSSGSTWAIDSAGALVITYNDGWTQRMEILDELNGEYGIFSDYTDGTERFATYTVYSWADAKPMLTAAEVTSLADRYYNGEVNSWIPGSFDENGARTADRRFGWQLNQNGTGQRRLGYTVGQWNPACQGQLGVQLDPMAWEVTPEGALQLSYSLFNPNVEGNRLYRIRTWYPAADGVIGEDWVLYVLEVDRLDFSDENQPLGIAPRLNIQREIPVQGDFCEIYDATGDGPAIRPQP